MLLELLKVAEFMQFYPLCFYFKRSSSICLGHTPDVFWVVSTVLSEQLLSTWEFTSRRDWCPHESTILQMKADLNYGSLLNAVTLFSAKLCPVNFSSDLCALL